MATTISHGLSNIHGLYGYSGNLLDITSIYSYQAVSPTNGLGTMLGVVGSGLSPNPNPNPNP